MNQRKVPLVRMPPNLPEECAGEWQSKVPLELPCPLSECQSLCGGREAGSWACEKCGEVLKAVVPSGANRVIKLINLNKIKNIFIIFLLI